jgi:hypothetical protein
MFSDHKVHTRWKALHGKQECEGRAGGVAQMVEYLCNKHEALSSNPTTGKKKVKSWALVAQACNPSYSGGRDQEDRGLKPAWAKKLVTKEGWWSASRCRPGVQAPIPPKQKKRK